MFTAPGARSSVSWVVTEKGELSEQAECSSDDGPHRSDSDTQILFGVMPTDSAGEPAAASARRLASPTRLAPTPQMTARVDCVRDTVECRGGVGSSGRHGIDLTRNTPIVGTIRVKVADTFVDPALWSYRRSEDRLKIDPGAWRQGPEGVRNTAVVKFYTHFRRCRPPK